MIVVIFLKNGKTWKLAQGDAELGKICPYDDAELKQIYEYTYYAGAMTEMPEDLLPKSFKETKLESITVFECPKCEKRFISWANGDWIELEFHEVKLIPENAYLERENEYIDPTAKPQPKEATDEWLNGKDEGHKCDGSCHKPNFRPMFYG
jgi:hypothetical protein